MFEKEAEEYAEDFVKDKYGGNRYCAKVQEEKLLLKIGFKDGYKAGFEDCAKARLNVTTISDCPIKDDELAKAKELLKDTLLMARVEGLKGRYETVDEIEQFLKEIEK